MSNSKSVESNIADAAAGSGPDRSSARTGPEVGGHSQEISADACSADADIIEFPGKGDTSNSPFPKTSTGGEDWLTLSLYVNHGDYGSLVRRLDKCREAIAGSGSAADEIQFGEFRFIVCPYGARQGDRRKGTWMRWKLQAENGIVLLLSENEKPNGTQPNGTVHVRSLTLMQYRVESVWGMVQHIFDSMGSTIVADKVSRVDVCVDLPGVPVSEFMQLFRNGCWVSRGRRQADYQQIINASSYANGCRPTGFCIGGHPLMCRIYDKLTESARSPEKLAVLKANRWRSTPESATRVEFQLGRPRLKEYGVDSLADWLEKRATICDRITSEWFRMTAEPVDRKHADRSDLHELWRLVRAGFAAWCGPNNNVELIPLAALPLDTSRQLAMVLGILTSIFARVGKQIKNNEHFQREVRAAIFDAIGEKNMAEVVRRKALELAAA